MLEDLLFLVDQVHVLIVQVDRFTALHIQGAHLVKVQLSREDPKSWSHN